MTERLLDAWLISHKEGKHKPVAMETQEVTNTVEALKNAKQNGREPSIVVKIMSDNGIKLYETKDIWVADIRNEQSS